MRDWSCRNDVCKMYYPWAWIWLINIKAALPKMLKRIESRT